MRSLNPFDHIKVLEARIEWLEQRLRQTTGEAVMANDRIEALETALRKIADMSAETQEAVTTAEYQHIDAPWKIARAALEGANK